MSKNLQNVRFFIVVITIHFSIVICATILSIFKPSVATIVSLLSHVFYRLGPCSVSELHLRRLEHYISDEEDFKKSADAKADRRFQSCQSYSETSIFGVACSGLHAYSLFIVYRFYRADEERPEPWMWWAFQTCFRLIEIAMACNISYCTDATCGYHL